MPIQDILNPNLAGDDDLVPSESLFSINNIYAVGELFLSLVDI